MKNKKTLIIVSIIVIAIVGVLLFLATGRARTDVYLKYFEVSADGKTMTLKIGVSSSAGYVRKMKRTSGSTNDYYTFYSTYGINSKIGAKDTFEIELDNNMDEIYFYTGNKGYKKVLVKNTITNEWQKINYSDNGPLKLNLFDKKEIIKVAINTGKQDNNYFEYDNKNTIEKIYNIFDDLETFIASTTFNPVEYEEMYTIIFYNDENMLLYSDHNFIKGYIEIYRQKGKYYVEQRYNGIYEITEEDFNLIKNYTKIDNSETDDIEYEKSTIEEIELKTEVDTMNHGNNEEEFTKYKTYIKNNKLYTKNLRTNEEKMIFDKEPVKNIAIRRICCAGDANLLILTTNGNVYISEKDCNYGFSFEFPFIKLNATNIVSFKLVPAFDYDVAKNLYGVDSNGKEILLHKIN